MKFTCKPSPSWSAQTESARERLAEKTAEREGLQGALQDRTKTLETGRRNVLRLLGEAAALKNQLAQISEYLSAMDRDSARAQKEEQTSLEDLERLTAVKADLSQKMAARQMQLESTADQRRRLEEDLTARKASAAETRRVLDQLRSEASHLKARRDSLEEILSHRAYTTESVKQLFTAIERGEAQDFRPAGVLADFIEVDANYEKAVEEFLHEELEYVVVQNWNEAERGIDIMRADFDGRATFLVHPEPEERPAPGEDLNSTEGLTGRLSDHLRFTNGFALAPKQLLPRLAHCFLAVDRGAAQKLATQHPDLFFLLPDGVSYHGHAVSGGKKTGSGPLALKRELRELMTEVGAKHKAVEETAAQARAAGSRNRQLERRPGKLAGAAAEPGKRSAWRWITSIASWPKNSPALNRGCRWRVWNWSVCARKRAAPARNRNAISNSSTRKKRLVRSKNRCWNNPDKIWRSCRPRRTSWWRSMARCGRT